MYIDLEHVRKWRKDGEALSNTVFAIVAARLADPKEIRLDKTFPTSKYAIGFPVDRLPTNEYVRFVDLVRKIGSMDAALRSVLRDVEPIKSIPANRPATMKVTVPYFVTKHLDEDGAAKVLTDYVANLLTTNQP